MYPGAQPHVELIQVCDQGDAERVAALCREYPQVATLGTGRIDIPLFCAVEAGSLDCVQLTLDAGERAGRLDDCGSTALPYAPSIEILELLLDRGADPKIVDNWRDDALDGQFSRQFECARDNDCPRLKQTVVLFRDHGVDIEYGPTEPRLWQAAFRHQALVVDVLVELGCSPHVIAPQSRTPLHAICWQGGSQHAWKNDACERIIRSLVAAGAGVNSRETSNDSTPLHEAAWGDWGNPTAIRVLLELGAERDPRGPNGETPLMWAARMGELECVRLPVDAGADRTLRDKAGKCALDWANEHLETWRSIADGDLDADVREQQKFEAESIQEAQQHGIYIGPLPPKRKARAELEARYAANVERAQAVVELLRA